MQKNHQLTESNCRTKSSNRFFDFRRRRNLLSPNYSRGGGGRLAFHENAGFSEERRGMHGMETNARADFSGEREAGGVHVSGCKYNRRVSRGEVKWPWRAVVHAE